MNMDIIRSIENNRKPILCSFSFRSAESRELLRPILEASRGLRVSPEHDHILGPGKSKYTMHVRVSDEIQFAMMTLDGLSTLVAAC
jgi:hypothetical protein